MRSDEHRYDDDQRSALLEIARGVLEAGVAGEERPTMELDRLDPALREERATFVTLKKNGELRGCMGSLTARGALAEDLSQSAHGAGFRDPRFSPVARSELAELEIHISVLGPLQPLEVDSEADLVSKLRPGVDGVVLSCGVRRGTFLPSVWDQLPEPRAFVRELKRKAGLPADGWEPTYRVERYAVESFP